MAGIIGRQEVYIYIYLVKQRKLKGEALISGRDFCPDWKPKRLLETTYLWFFV